MKKILAIMVTMSFCSLVFSQNVGIGTSNPDSTALLDIRSNSKGVLFPQVYLNNSADNTHVPGAAYGLIVFNTNNNLAGGKGLYFNSGTAQSPYWTKTGELTFPYNGGASTSSPAFNIMNYGADAASVAIKGYSEHSIGVYGQSNSGTGVYATSTNGTALEVNGTLKIAGNGQAPAAGKVLTSDANGNATWEGAVAFNSMGIQPDGAATFSSGTEKKVPFYTESYDIGSNYNPSSISPYSTFTTPVKGIYHFDVKTTWSSGSLPTGGSEMKLKFIYNGNTGIIAIDAANFTESFTKHNINIDVLLEANVQVFVTLLQNTGDNMSLITSWGGVNKSSYFSGRLVTRL